MSDKKCLNCGSSRIVKNGRRQSGVQRHKCQECGYRPTNPHLSKPPSVEFSSKIPRSKKYLITAAQNATPVFGPFLDALRNYARHISAELIVIPFRYRNPTSLWSEQNETNEWWDEQLSPHLYDGRFDLNKYLTILADIKVQPTAVSPLTGLESITGERSGVVGHPKVQLITIPTPHHKLPKIMVTTGAVTVLNYSDTKTGKKGEFHHTFGAAMVEVGRDIFHLRQIIACRDGSFNDLDKEATKDGVKRAPQAEALVMGDTHVDFIDPRVIAATFTAPDCMVKTIRPKNLVWHDLLDFYSRSHHHRGDPILAQIKHRSGLGDVRAEVERACSFIDIHAPGYTQNILVPSNHPEALARWIKESDWRNDPENAEFYLETALAVVRSARMSISGGASVDPFLYWAKQLVKSKLKFLSRDESCVLKGVEVGMHGDRGLNGARGNIRGFSKIGIRSTVAHGHSPGIYEGCYQVGTSTYLRLNYNSGPSSWLNTHCVHYGNGKRSLLNIINGTWRL